MTLAKTMQNISQILKTEPILVVDGSNRFRIDHLAKMAHILGISPVLVLKHVYLSRAFTCHQMAEIICHRTYTKLKQSNSQHLVCVGLLDTFFDESIPFTEAKKLLIKTINSLNRISKIAEIHIVEPHFHEISGPRKEFLNLLKNKIKTKKNKFRACL